VLKQRHKNKDLAVTVTIDDDVPPITADPDKLVEIVRNIVDNAFNYTPADGRIDILVRLQSDKRNVLLSVADTGLGIPENYREAVWRRFERYEEHALTMDVAGTGLGLPIVKELVSMHHGDVWFESEVGKGTTFFVSLPIDQPEFRTTTAELKQAEAESTEE
jgi:signal transduction histidine kinase